MFFFLENTNLILYFFLKKISNNGKCPLPFYIFKLFHFVLYNDLHHVLYENWKFPFLFKEISYATANQRADIMRNVLLLSCTIFVPIRNNRILSSFSVIVRNSYRLNTVKYILFYETSKLIKLMSFCYKNKRILYIQHICVKNVFID